MSRYCGFSDTFSPFQKSSFWKWVCCGWLSVGIVLGVWGLYEWRGRVCEAQKPPKRRPTVGSSSPHSPSAKTSSPSPLLSKQRRTRANVHRGKSAKGRGFRIRYRTHWIDSRLAPDEAMEAFLQPFRKKLMKRMKRTITTITQGFSRRRPESSLGNLVADLCLARMRYEGLPVEVFITNLGGIRNDLAAGKVTLGDLYEILPFDNQLIWLRIRGSRLLRLLGRLAQKGGEPIAGGRLVIEPKQGRVSHVMIHGKPLQPEREYILGTSDYLAKSGWIKPYVRGISLQLTKIALRDAVIWGLRYNLEPLQPRVEGRVRYKVHPSGAWPFRFQDPRYIATWSFSSQVIRPTSRPHRSRPPARRLPSQPSPPKSRNHHSQTTSFPSRSPPTKRQ